MGLARFSQGNIDQHGETDLCWNFHEGLLIDIGVIALEKCKNDY